MKYKVREAQREDAISVARVQVHTWKATYSGIVPDQYLDHMTYEKREKKWEEWIPKQNVYVAENEQGDIVGFSNGGKKWTTQFPNDTGELYAIYILKNNQRQGLGRQLLKPLLDRFLREGVYSMVVSVLKDNPYRSFYERLGGAEIDTKEVNIDGEMLEEVVLGWKDLRMIDL
jgi:ribosomal protein S18 acetylase RimI-like enzyme